MIQRRLFFIFFLVIGFSTSVHATHEQAPSRGARAYKRLHQAAGAAIGGAAGMALGAFIGICPDICSTQKWATSSQAKPVRFIDAMPLTLMMGATDNRVLAKIVAGSAVLAPAGIYAGYRAGEYTAIKSIELYQGILDRIEKIAGKVRSRALKS